VFIGHGLLAFAIAASVASHRGWSTDRAIVVGVLAGLFGTLPDVDMAYALVGVASGAEGLFAASDAFWAAASVVHRAVTHSLVLGLVAAVGFAAWRARASRPALFVAVGLLGGLVAAVSSASGPVATAIAALFVLAGLGIVRVARWSDIGPRTVLSAALVGLLTHPFGDLVTGTPPRLLYPVEWTVFSGRVTLHPDPTLHLLGAFFLELAVIWAAVVVYARLRGWRLAPLVDPRAALGVGYAGAVFAIPAPTLQLSWPFVGSVLAVGVVAVPLSRGVTGNRAWRTITTALAAVTLAGVAYTVAYILVL
jgi:membrane-bound metal-dependent hydrolase YbcI (DUF457 family)